MVFNTRKPFNYPPNIWYLITTTLYCRFALELYIRLYVALNSPSRQMLHYVSSFWWLTSFPQKKNNNNDNKIQPVPTSFTKNII